MTLNLPIGIWLMSMFIREVPRELEEAARIDGCATLQMLWRIVVPGLMPGMAATAILVFIISWNEFVVALNLTARQTATVPVAIAKYAQENETKYGVMAAGAVLSVMPARRCCCSRSVTSSRGSPPASGDDRGGMLDWTSKHMYNFAGCFAHATRGTGQPTRMSVRERQIRLPVPRR